MKAYRAVLIIDSNLSRDPYGARLEVEVIGIFPDDGGVRTAVGPTMAMVALKSAGTRTMTKGRLAKILRGTFEGTSLIRRFRTVCWRQMGDSFI
jgi:uncharacterized membrane protein